MKNPMLTRRAAISIGAVVLLLGTALTLLIQSKVLVIRGEEVVISSDDATLAATVAVPRRGNGPFPAVVVVHGSGPVTRGELRAYGGQLAPLGIVTLTYDKRGVGESTGRYRPFRVSDCEALISELATDVLAAVEYLRERDDVDADRIGLFGGSQAGWIMPLAASQSDDVAFIVSISGPAVTCGQVGYYQTLTGVSTGVPKEIPDSEISELVAGFAGPHGYDPVAALKSVSVPMLWILGSRDPNVPTALTESIVREMTKSGPAQHTVLVYPDGDHDLHHASTGALIDPLPDIRTWLQATGF